MQFRSLISAYGLLALLLSAISLKGQELGTTLGDTILYVVGEPLTFQIYYSPGEETGDNLHRLVLSRQPAGMTFDDGSGNVTWRPVRSQIGKYSIVVEGFDIDGSRLVRKDLRLIVSNANHPPRIYPIGDKWSSPGDSLSFDVRTDDVDGDPVVLIARNLPPDATFTDGHFLWLPSTERRYQESYSVMFVASDEQLSDTQQVMISLARREADPKFMEFPRDYVVREGGRLDILLYATDPNGGDLRYLLASIPEGGEFGIREDGLYHFVWSPPYTYVNPPEKERRTMLQFKVEDETGRADIANVTVMVVDEISGVTLQERVARHSQLLADIEQLLIEVRGESHALRESLASKRSTSRWLNITGSGLALIASAWQAWKPVDTRTIGTIGFGVSSALVTGLAESVKPAGDEVDEYGAYLELTTRLGVLLYTVRQRWGENVTTEAVRTQEWQGDIQTFYQNLGEIRRDFNIAKQ